MSIQWAPQIGHTTVKMLAEESLYSGYCSVKRFHFQHPLFNGEMSHTITREVLMRPPSVAVLPFDPEKDEVVLIEQFRMGTLGNVDNPWILEIVAGMVDGDETPRQTAFRETIEEAGCEILSLLPIAEVLISPGISTEKTTIYCAKVIAPTTPSHHGLLEDGEDIKAHVFKTKDALDLLKNGKIISATAIIALQWLEINRASLRFPQ